MTPLNEALSQLADIRTQLVRAQVYRGLTARPVALSGLVGILAAGLQHRFVSEGDAFGFVIYWLAVAALSACVAGSTAIYSYCMEEDALARRRAQVVAGQLIPCLVAGTFLVLGVMPTIDRSVGLLPGLWAMLYGLGLFSVRPFLPHATGWVGLFFLAAGTLLLTLLPQQAVPSPWSIALVFAAGQFGLAWVLYRNSVREPHLV